MAVLHDFICHECDVVFEDVSSYDNEARAVAPVPCPLCERPSGIVWLKAPSMNGDENLTAEEKVAAALKLGFRGDGRLILPQTRSDLAKIRAAVGDFKVGEREIMTGDGKRHDARTTAEREADKAETIEHIRRRRAALRSGNVPRADVDSETKEAMNSAPINRRRVLAGKVGA